MGLVPTLDAIPPVRGRRGRPRRRPGKLHADKGYDYARCRRDCRTRGIKPRIARRGIDSSQRLGRHRWVIERTLAWLARFRRLTVRYERRQDIWTAFHSLADALICHKSPQLNVLKPALSPPRHMEASGGDCSINAFLHLVFNC